MASFRKVTTALSASVPVSKHMPMLLLLDVSQLMNSTPSMKHTMHASVFVMLSCRQVSRMIEIPKSYSAS